MRGWCAVHWVVLKCITFQNIIVQSNTLKCSTMKRTWLDGKAFQCCALDCMNRVSARDLSALQNYFQCMIGAVCIVYCTVERVVMRQLFSKTLAGVFFAAFLCTEMAQRNWKILVDIFMSGNWFEIWKGALLPKVPAFKCKKTALRAPQSKNRLQKHCETPPKMVG